MRKLINDPYKNWRGMQTTGGRRIKRAIFLDQRSVRFLTDEEIRRLRDFVLLDKYLDAKQTEIDNWNA